MTGRKADIIHRLYELQERWKRAKDIGKMPWKDVPIWKVGIRGTVSDPVSGILGHHDEGSRRKVAQVCGGSLVMAILQKRYMWKNWR